MILDSEGTLACITEVTTRNGRNIEDRKISAGRAFLITYAACDRTTLEAAGSVCKSKARAFFLEISRRRELLLQSQIKPNVVITPKANQPNNNSLTKCMTHLPGSVRPEHSCSRIIGKKGCPENGAKVYPKAAILVSEPIFWPPRESVEKQG